MDKQSQAHAHVPGLSNRTTAQKYLSATRKVLTCDKSHDRLFMKTGKLGPSTLEEKPGLPGLVSLTSASLVLPSLSKLRQGGGEGKGPMPIGKKGGRQSSETLCETSGTIKSRLRKSSATKVLHKVLVLL